MGSRAKQNVLATLADIQDQAELLEDRVTNVADLVADIHSGLSVHTTAITVNLMMAGRKLAALVGVLNAMENR